MTASEMMYEAEIMYESIASSDARGYNSAEWSVLLTQAQENLIMSLVAAGFDDSEVLRRVVANLIRYVSIMQFIPQTNILNAYLVDPTSFPSDYYHRVSGRCSTNSKDNIRLIPIEYDAIDINRDNPFRRPDENMFWLLAAEESQVIITDGSTPTAYNLEYLKKAPPIIVELLTESSIEGETAAKDCILSPSVHRAIVSEAAKLAYSYSKDTEGFQLLTSTNP